MRILLKDLWQNNRKEFLNILLLNVLVALMGGVGIVMLVPMLAMLDVPIGQLNSIQLFLSPLLALSRIHSMAIIGATYLILLVVKALLNRHLAISQSIFTEKHGVKLRQDLYDAVTSANWETLSQWRKTDFIDLFTTQCGRFTHGVSSLITFLASIFNAVVQLIIASFLNFPATIAVLICGACFLWTFRSFKTKSRRYGEEVIEINQSFFGELYEQLGSIKETRAYSVEAENRVRFQKASARFYDCHIKYTQLSSRPQLFYAMGAALLITMLLFVSMFVIEIGTAQLIVLVYIFARLWPVFASWQSKIQDIASCLPSCEAIRKTKDLLQENPLKPTEQIQQISFAHKICFDQVSFRYKNSIQTTLQNADFEIHHGTITALVGGSGVGKSTTADLLLGLLTPTAGRIFVDDTEITAKNAAAWRKNIGYVPQEPLILNGTVRENFLRFQPYATEAQMIDALKRSYSWNFIENLENGLDTNLGDQGIRLSGGEKQRLVLARVLLTKPQFLILDEATSALDYESERMIRNALQDMRGQTTILIIAHRLATVLTADQAIVLESGRIAEADSLHKLLQKENGYLARMFAAT